MEESILWTTNGVGDGAAEITRAQWIDMFTMLFLRDNTAQGIAPAYLNALAVSSTGNNNVRVASGGAVVRGFLYRSSGNVDHTISSPVADTGFRVVLRADFDAQTVRSDVVMNTTGVTDPPALTQEEDEWEISLATGTITSGGVIAVTSAPTAMYHNTKVSTAMLDDLAVTTAKLAADSVTTAKILDDNVTNAKLADNSVDTAQLVDNAVTAAKIATGAVGAAEIDTGAVGTSELADDSVTYEKAGDGIIQFPERQGGSNTNWISTGTTTYQLGGIRMHMGARLVNINAGSANATLSAVTYPTAYANPPLVFAQVYSPNKVTWIVDALDATDFDVIVTRKDETDTGSQWAVVVFWLSVGGA